MVFDPLTTDLPEPVEEDPQEVLPLTEVVSFERGAGTSPASTVMYRVGGRSYPLRHVAQCRVCSSPDRTHIEEALLKGYGYAAVARHYGNERITTKHVGDHVRNGHLPMDLTVRRAIMEERAQQIGKSIEDAEANLIDHLGFARVGLQRVLERMAAGEIEPDIKDGIEFAKMILKIEELAGDGGDLDQEIVFRGFVSYMQAVQKVCTGPQVQEIGRLIAANPVIKGYLSRASVIDVEEEHA